MEKNISKLLCDNKAGNNNSFNSKEKTSSNGNRGIKKKELNSWDCSTRSTDGQTPKEKNSDWDSGSECQETMVEPFDNKRTKDSDSWDSETENQSIPKFSFGKGERIQEDIFYSTDLSEVGVSNSEKFSSDTMSNMGFNKKRLGSYNISDGKNEDLLVEDIEEFLKEESTSKYLTSKESKTPISDVSIRTKKVPSNHSEGTLEDTTIWMIPNSERTQSEDSTSKLISISDKKKLEKIIDFRKENFRIKKAKSLSNMRKLKKKRKSSRSAGFNLLNPFESDKNFGGFLFKCEGPGLHKGLEIETNTKNESILHPENVDRTRVFFTEYECRTMTIDKDEPEKLPEVIRSVLSSTESLPDFGNIDSNDNSESSPNNIHGRSTNSEAVISDLLQPGPSAVPSLDVMSLPDMIGKNSIKERPNKEKFIRKTNTMKGRNEVSNLNIKSNKRTNQVSESWFFLDETGQYQAVTRNEVNILLNGRSMDAVLQGKKEHLIPSSTLADPISPRGSINCMLTKESFQYFLREEDIGGENDGKKLVDLERKMENTLLYIQPGMNLTASIRIIPVDTEMVHVWRRTRDTGSVLSSEVDLRLHSSQDSVGNTSQRNPNGQPSFTRRLTTENRQQTVTEQDETPPLAESTKEGYLGYHSQDIASTTDYSTLLIETRMIVDDLTNSLKNLQCRLDGETNRSLVLQGEVNKLRHLLKSMGGKNFLGKNSRETIINQHLFLPDISSSASLLTVKAVPDKVDVKSDSIIEESSEVDAVKSSTEISDGLLDSNQNQKVKLEESCDAENGCITVNIFTMEKSASNDCVVKVQETNSLLQANLGMIESKMKLLQEENEAITKQNLELKRKLKEISLELEKYLAGTSCDETYPEDDIEQETLQDQVCNLKLDLDHLQKTAWCQEVKLKTDSSLILEESTKQSFVLDEWFTIAAQLFQQIEIEKRRLNENGITIDINIKHETIKEPKNFFQIFNSYLQQITESLLLFRDQNLMYEQTLKETRHNLTENHGISKEIAGLDQVISGYTQLIEQCRKGFGEPRNTVMEDYFTVIMEKAALLKEIKILKTENEMLLESQLEHYEKLKQTMIALKDRKSEITALESNQKLTENEKSKMADILKLREESEKHMQIELIEKNKMIEDLMLRLRRKEAEISDVNEKLKDAAAEIKNIEKFCQLKDELIEEFNMKNDQLLNSEGILENQIELLKGEIKSLEIQKDQLESELASAKLLLNDTQKEMTDYITHLETLVNNSQEALDKTKLKLKDSNTNFTQLKNEYDILKKQHNCDSQLYDKTKDKLNDYTEKLMKLSNQFKEMEEENRNLKKNFEIVANSNKEKSEALDVVAKEYKMVLNENTGLKDKLEKSLKDKDESLKKQKDLINKYEMLSKEYKTLQQKYKNVKAECNERTDLIKYLESMLKENIIDYNNRVACLEKNISHILEKIAACKNCVREKHSSVTSKVRELRHQLDETYQERKELEHLVSDYYSMMKHLENEVEERERKVVELHAKLEQHKVTYNENDEKFLKSSLEEPNKAYENLTIDQLVSKIGMTESELLECRQQLQSCQISYENEKKKLDLTIADLKSEINRYQIRTEVMMRNLSNCTKNFNGITPDKKLLDNANVQFIKKEMEEKDKKINELNETINKYKVEIKMKDSDLENSKKKIFSLNEELKVLRNHFSKTEKALSASEKDIEIQQKEKKEMAEKLLQSIKLIMEEKSARQAIELVTAEKEKVFKEQMDEFKNQLMIKEKESETLSSVLAEKKKYIKKILDDMRKMKLEIASFKKQICYYKKKKYSCNEKTNVKNCQNCSELQNHTISLTDMQAPNSSVDRLESCLRELKEVRDINIQLRKSEGHYRTKIIQLEDEIRDARFLIKELQGDIKTEKKSKKALKNMILSAKTEIEKCLAAKQIISSVADKINRYLELSDIPSRELLSGFRFNDKCYSSILSMN